MVIHIVLLRWVDDAPAEAVVDVLRDWPALQGRVGGLHELSCGRNFGGELGAVSNGWTHAAVAKLHDRKAFAEFLAHPDYRRVLGRLRPLLGGLLEVDYEVDDRPQAVVGGP